MEKNANLQALIDKYNRELMQLHARQSPTAAATTPAPAPVAVPESVATPEPELPYIDELPPLPLPEEEPVLLTPIPPDEHLPVEQPAPPAEMLPAVEERVPPPPPEAPPFVRISTPPAPEPPLTEGATLQFQVTTAEDAAPLSGVFIELSRRDELSGGDVVVEMVKTDAEGRSPLMTLPAAPGVFSLDPQAERPYSTYQASLTKAGYFRVRIRRIPLFGGVNAVQPVEMIPLPDPWDGGDRLDIEEGRPRER